MPDDCQTAADSAAVAESQPVTATKPVYRITSPAAAPSHPSHAKFILGLIGHMCLDSLPIVLKLIPTPSADTTIALESLGGVLLKDAAAAIIQVAAQN